MGIVKITREQRLRIKRRQAKRAAWLPSKQASQPQNAARTKKLCDICRQRTVEAEADGPRDYTSEDWQILGKRGFRPLSVAEKNGLSEGLFQPVESFHHCQTCASNPGIIASFLRKKAAERQEAARARAQQPTVRSKVSTEEVPS